MTNVGYYHDLLRRFIIHYCYTFVSIKPSESNRPLDLSWFTTEFELELLLVLNIPSIDLTSSFSDISSLFNCLLKSSISSLNCLLQLQWFTLSRTFCENPMWFVIKGALWQGSSSSSLPVLSSSTEFNTCVLTTGLSSSSLPESSSTWMVA